jgi:uncharacterized protein DUF6812
MQEKKIRYRKVYRKVTIKTTDGSTLSGKVNIGMHERASDLFTKSDSPFIVMTDVELRECSGKVFFVNKDQIVWAEPDPEDYS